MKLKEHLAATKKFKAEKVWFDEQPMPKQLSNRATFWLMALLAVALVGLLEWVNLP